MNALAVPQAHGEEQGFERPRAKQRQQRDDAQKNSEGQRCGEHRDPNWNPGARGRIGDVGFDHQQRDTQARKSDREGPRPARAFGNSESRREAAGQLDQSE